MWLFPVLWILTAAAMVDILVQMYLQKEVRSQLLLSLLSWAVVIVVYLASSWVFRRRPAVNGTAVTARHRNVANEAIPPSSRGSV
jgi:GABA permease